MNIIVINEEKFTLPEEVEVKRSVLNHIDMVRKGVKDFAKMYKLNGEVVKLSHLYIKDAEIQVKNHVTMYALSDNGKIIETAKNSTSINELFESFITQLDYEDEKHRREMMDEYRMLYKNKPQEFFDLWGLKITSASETCF